MSGQVTDCETVKEQLMEKDLLKEMQMAKQMGMLKGWKKEMLMVMHLDLRKGLCLAMRKVILTEKH